MKIEYNGQKIDETTATNAINELSLYELFIVERMMRGVKAGKENTKMPVITQGAYAIGVNRLLKRGYIEWWPSTFEVFCLNLRLSSVKQYRFTEVGKMIAPFWFKYRQTEADKQ